MRDESRAPGREWWSKSQPSVPRSGSLREAGWGPEAAERDAYALALEVFERLFLEQRARIATEMEEACVVAEESDFTDYRRISRAATRAARVSWEADDQMAGLKKRLDELYQERVVEPIMEVRRLSARMEERNRERFRRRVGDRR